MSPPKVFSLAVIKGPSKGEALRTDKKRISVGRGSNNDLVLQDPQIAKRHFMVLIDQDRWRIHTFSPDNSITVDRRWTHPSTGKRGAIVFASGVEILLYPGPLEQSVVDAEVAQRMTGGMRVPEPNQELVTAVFDKAIEFDSDEITGAPTVSVSLGGGKSQEMDIVEMSQMATIAGERPPDDLAAAARVKLVGERSPIAPSVLRETSADPLANQPVKNAPTGDIWEEQTIGVDTSSAPQPKRKKKRASWDSARKPAKPEEPSIPEVIAQPESQMMSLATRSQKSTMQAKPSFDRPAEAQVIELDTDRAPRKKKKNAWGDPSEEETRLPAVVPPEKKKRKKNAWGDSDKKKNAWGDGDRRKQPPPARNDTAPPPPRNDLEKRGPQAIYAGRQVSVPELLKTSRDPALQIVREPDGEFATAMRLLGTKMEEFARTLGYRAYMFTSPEPLTGKTTMITNLAFALAEDTNRRVALVEANFRFPRLFEILGTPEREGMLPVLEGRAQLSESVVKVKDRNLVVLPTGGRHPHPAEILASPRFKQLIAELANTVDIAVLDAPSTAPYADANLLLPMVDAAFLVVADRSTRSKWVDQALQQIGMNRVLGALYNTLPKSAQKGLKEERKQRMKS